ncbi:MAG: type VI secretion system Vgr family protein [Gammaproteobacteria bacterium]
MATPEFTFKSAAYAQDTFTVVDFQGSEAISSLYQFNIGLKCTTALAINLEELLGATATLSIEQGAATNSYSGILACVEQQQQAGGHNYYRVLLVPPAWRLSRNLTTAGFTGEAHPNIVETVLANGSITVAGAELDITGITGNIAPSPPSDSDTTEYVYPLYDFTCQYVETDLNFVSRLMEYDGIYFYFEDNAGVCKMLLADGMAYPQQPTAASIPFTDPSSTNNYDSIVQITQQLGVAPAVVSVTGYNYQTTSVEVTGNSDVSVDGVTSSALYPAAWLYDNKVQTPAAAARIALVRAQEHGSWSCTYTGGGAVSGLRAGFTFSLTDHPVTAFNQSYLVTSVTHTARNLDQSWTTASHTAAQAASIGAYYNNTFTAIPASVQFRPRRATPKPRISGVLSAAVWLQPDTSSGTTSNSTTTAPTNLSLQPGQSSPIPGYQGSGSAQDENAYVPPPPPMDVQGRYLVTLPFANGAVTGSSSISAWIRMAQPSAGQWTGVQYMLEPGAEVLLVFVNGDPDLPLIAGAVYNGANPAPLTSANNDPQI